MARFIKNSTKAKGAAPGSLIFIGRQKMKAPKTSFICYSEQDYKEKAYSKIDDILNAINPDAVNWINIYGLHDVTLFQKLGKHFNISALALENVLNTGQRPKFFENKHSCTLITKAVTYSDKEDKISVDQISFILINNTLISIQEKPGDHFEPVRNRLRQEVGRIRKSGADYLLFALVDCLVDNYLINIEQLGGKIEALETQLSSPGKDLGQQLYQYKTEIHYFRKSILPLKEAISRLLRSDSDFVKPESQVFYKELIDSTTHAIESTDAYSTMIADQMNILNTNLTNRVNDVMKVLTIFASIFIPLTFIAGIYGTNFQYLPELGFKYAYFVMWGVMLLVAGIMLMYFKRKKWL